VKNTIRDKVRCTLTSNGTIVFIACIRSSENRRQASLLASHLSFFASSHATNSHRDNAAELQLTHAFVAVIDDYSLSLIVFSSAGYSHS